MGDRLFVSVDLDSLADGIAAAQAPFREADGLTFVDPAQAHVTLKFLGDTDPDRIPDIVAALETAVETAGVDPFEVRLGGLGVFPSRSYISVIWLGVRAGGADLTALQAAIEDRIVALGFDPEDHDFTPHVTLARMRHAGGKDRVQHLLDERDPDAGATTVSEIRLTESVRTAEGPVYSTVASVPLS